MMSLGNLIKEIDKYCGGKKKSKKRMLKVIRNSGQELIAIFNRVSLGREDLSKDLINVIMGIGKGDIWEKGFPGGGDSWYKGPRVGMCQVR